MNKLYCDECEKSYHPNQAWIHASCEGKAPPYDPVLEDKRARFGQPNWIANGLGKPISIESLREQPVNRREQKPVHKANNPVHTDEPVNNDRKAYRREWMRNKRAAGKS